LWRESRREEQRYRDEEGSRGAAENRRRHLRRSSLLPLMPPSENLVAMSPRSFLVLVAERN
jgi:hypothetical protein